MDTSKWVPAVYNEYGITQWGWRVNYRENFKMSDNVRIGSFTSIDARYGVEIQDEVIIGQSCVIASNSRISGKSGKVTLKKGCKIGAQSTVVPGVTIGENSIVGANSYIDKDIPDGEVWFGSPAKYVQDVAEMKKDKPSIYPGNPNVPM
jgi:acetyltransferase-like isoleucine patch superfamily enzyme